MGGERDGMDGAEVLERDGGGGVDEKVVCAWGGGRQQLFMKTMRNERLGRKRKSRLRAGGQMRVNKRAKT